MEALGVTPGDVRLTPAEADDGNPMPGSYDIRDKGTSEMIGSYAETPTGCEVTVGNDKVVMSQLSDSDVRLERYAKNDDGDFELLGMSRIGNNDGIITTRPFMGY